MFIEPAILGGNERVANLFRNHRDRDVDAANVLEVSDESIVTIVNVAAFARMERADLGRARTAVKATGSEPGVERDDADACEGEQAQPWPVPPDPDAERR